MTDEGRALMARDDDGNKVRATFIPAQRGGIATHAGTGGIGVVAGVGLGLYAIHLMTLFGWLVVGGLALPLVIYCLTRWIPIGDKRAVDATFLLAGMVGLLWVVCVIGAIAVRTQQMSAYPSAAYYQYGQGAVPVQVSPLPGTSP